MTNNLAQNVTNQYDEHHMEPYVDMPQILKHFHISRNSVNAYLAKGLPSMRLPGGFHRFRISEVEAWLMRNQGKGRRKNNATETGSSSIEESPNGSGTTT